MLGVPSGLSPPVQIYKIDAETGSIIDQANLDSTEEGLDIYERVELGGSCDFSQG